MYSIADSLAGESIPPIQYLSINPPALRLRSNVCVVRRGDLAIRNDHLDRTIRITSVSSNDSQFQVVNFSSIYLGPSNIKLVYVIYHPLSIGQHDVSFTFKTSDGDISYLGQGFSEDNSYRIHPIVSVVASSTTPLSIPITIYNPHNKALKILDISSSYGITLTGFPGDETISDTNWNIPPDNDRTVVTARVRADSVGEREGRIDIQTSIDLVIVPIHVSIVDGGIIATPSIVDFGSLYRSSYQSRNLLLQNIGERDVLVTAILTENFDINVDIDHRRLPILISGSAVVPVSFANVTYAASREGNFHGYIVLLTNNSYINQSSLKIPYRGSVKQEGIDFDLNETLLVIAPRSNLKTYHLTLRNRFVMPMILERALVEKCSKFLKIHKFVGGVEVESGSAWDRLKLIVNSQRLAKRIITTYPFPVRCFVLLETNTTSHKIQLFLLNETLRLTYSPEVISIFGDCDDTELII